LRNVARIITRRRKLEVTGKVNLQFFTKGEVHLTGVQRALEERMFRESGDPNHSPLLSERNVSGRILRSKRSANS